MNLSIASWKCLRYGGITRFTAQDAQSDIRRCLHGGIVVCALTRTLQTQSSLILLSPLPLLLLDGAFAWLQSLLIVTEKPLR